MFEAVLFDLDGTLADTAPDLGGATNQLLQEENRPVKSIASLRPFVSQGVKGLLWAGLGIAPDHADYDRLTERFLELYSARLWKQQCCLTAYRSCLMSWRQTA